MLTIANWTAQHTLDAAHPNRIDIWSLDLTVDCSEQKDLLSQHESDRLSRISQPLQARRFVSSRVQLRLLLAKYLPISPESIQLDILPGGKPRVRQDPPLLEFNMTHHGDHALVAITSDRKVGIDIEKIRTIPRYQAIARRVLSPEAQTTLEKNPDPETFVQQWTLMEASQKTIGGGVFSEKASRDLVETHLFTPYPGFCAAIGWERAEMQPDIRFYLHTPSDCSAKA
ncbi:MAG: 4'-phosphopantetheinyl transferase family protein [bacterium]